MIFRTHAATFVILAAVLVAPAGLAATADQKAIDNLMAKVQACSRAKDASCLQKHVDDPETLYIVTHDGKRELYPSFREEAFSPDVASLYTVSVGLIYKYKIFMTSKQTAEVVFFNIGKAGADDIYAKMIGTDDVLQCSVRRTQGAWKLGNSVCGYIYAGEFE